MLPIKKYILIFLAIIAGILAIFFGYTYYLMVTSNGSHLTMFVETKEDVLGQKIRTDFPIQGEDDITYVFPVVFEKVLETDSVYKFTLSPTVFPKDSVRGEKFEYELGKDKYEGDIDIKSIEPGAKVYINLQYDLSKNLRYFLEYSVCTVKKAYSDLFKLDLTCGRGNCIVNRDIDNWDIKKISSEITEKVEYFESYNPEELSTRLLNFFITDDFGYFNPEAFRYVSTQTSRPDGTFSFATQSINNPQDGKNSTPSIFWLLTGVSGALEREDIDLEGYMSTVLGYLDGETYGEAYFQNCTASSYIIENLKSCSSQSCEDVKSKAFEYCEETLQTAIAKYDTTAQAFSQYTRKSILRGYLFGISSEMIKYNKIAQAMGLEPKYTMNDLSSFYEKGKGVLGNSEEILPICYQLKSAKDIYNEYPLDSLLLDIEILYGKIDGLETICDKDSRNTFCELSISEKLVCVDALMGYKNIEAKNLLSDIFYRHYFESPGAVKMVTYENWRFSPFSEENPNSYTKIEDYGYLTSIVDDEGFVTHSAHIGDSYYFINLLRLLNNE